MKILIYNWRDIKNPRAGGAEIYTHEIAKRLVERGYEVTWFTAAFPRCEKEEKIDGIKIIRAGGRIGVYLQAKKYYKRAFKGQFDVVVDEINTRPFMTPNFVKEPIVALIHQLAREFWFYETPFPVSVLGYYWLENKWLKHYRDVPTITVSESTKKDLQKLGFQDIEIIPLGIGDGTKIEPLKEVPRKETRPTSLFIGRMTKAKLPDHALEAFRYVKQKVPEAQLWMVGDGPMLKKLRKVAQRRRFADVTFWGRVSEEKKLELMQKAHVLLVPGVREGWGRVVTEANAMGTPAVGYDIPGLRDSIRHGESGVICSPNPRALADQAINLLEGNDFTRLSYNALQYAKQFTWDESVARFVMALSRVQVVGEEEYIVK